MNPLLSSLLAQYSVQVEELMNLLEAKRITPSVWRDRMADLLARYHIAALMVGAGETAVPPAGVAILARNLTNQYGYLDNFATEVAAAEAFRNAWRARAQMYTQSAGASFWDGEIYRQAGRFLPLPAVPKDGTTQCMCITTPHSLVSTMRGDIPIVDVVPGDMVLTHRMRWRRVLKTFVNRSMPTHQQAWIITPDGRKIGCTTEHKWYTPNGWKTAISIHNSRDAMYNVPHEHMQEMRRGNGKSVQEGSVQILPSSMRVWEQERSQGNELQVVWDEEFSAYAMGFFGWAEKEDEGAERGGGYTAENEGGRSEWRGPELGEKGGRPLFHVLLGRGAPALHLPLPSGMDTRLRGDTQRHGHTPYRRGSGERRFEQPATYDPERSQFLSHGRGTKARNGGREGERVRDKAGVGLPDLRGDIREIPESWQSATEILLGDMLPEGTALYDLQVEEDHSFIVDGIVTHNSNCKCSLRVEVVDAVANDFDVYWVMHPAEHCQTCIERAAQWNPLQIRDGMLMETAVKHLADQHDQMTHGGGGSLGRFENWAAENMTSGQISQVRNGLSAMTDEKREEFFTDAMSNMRDYSSHDALREFMLKRTAVGGDSEERIGTLNGTAVIRVDGKFSQMPDEGAGIVVGVSGYGDRGIVAYGSASDGHSRIVSMLNGNLDNYVRMIWEGGSIYINSATAGAVDRERAFRNIYRALDMLHAKGIPANTPVFIWDAFGGNNRINTTVKSARMSYALSLKHLAGQHDQMSHGHSGSLPMKTPGASLQVGYAGMREGFNLTSPHGKAQGYLYDADFPGDRSSRTRGELFYVEVARGSQGRGHGRSLAEDSLRAMLNHGAKTVNMSAVTDAGRGLIRALERDGAIRFIRESETGKVEYEINPAELG